MSTQTVTKKRKSTGDAAVAAKKPKIAKSADKPAPLKSALKKAKEEKAVKPAVKPAEATKKKKAKKAEKPKKEEPVVEDEEDDNDIGQELTADQTADLLAGFSSSEDEAEEEDGVAIEKLPQAPRTKEVQKRIEDATKNEDPESTPGVIYVGRIPHGFYEPQMRAYFSQFGDILHLRLARNRKTGKSRNYAFIEFASKAVAEIVAKTMDKYLLFGHILQVRTIPREQIKENIFDNSAVRKRPAPRNKIEGGRLRRGMPKEGWEQRIKNEEERRKEKAEKLKEMGYEFEMPGLKSVEEVKTAETTAGAEDEAPKLLKESEEVVDTEVTEVVKTAKAGPEEVTVTKEKVEATKKRPSGEAKAKKGKKLKK
jgi:nucleolar protein 15